MKTERPVLRRTFGVLLALVLVVAVAACGGEDSDDESTSTDAAPDTAAGGEDATDATPEAPELGNVVALAEEFLLADLLSLGIEPIASTATVESVGFQGLGDFDTSEIEVLSQTNLNLEHLASLQPDTIITLQFWVDQVGAEVLAGMTDRVVVIPDGVWGTERIEFLGDELGRPGEAAAAVEAYDTALAAAQSTVPDDCVVSLATVYSGPSVAAFVDGPWEMPSSIQALGCTLDPGPDVAEGDQNGRAWLSMEQVDILDADTLILMQSSTVDGEDAAIAEVEADRLWQTLPAVQADRVVVVDRLGYPGLQGQTAFLDVVASALAE